MRRRIRQIAAAAMFAMGAGAGVSLAGTATVNVSSTPVGKTLRHVGYNMGHYLPGSNTSAWVDYSGVNAFRVWAASSEYEVAHGAGTMRDDLDPWGDGVSSLTSFNDRKAALRGDPLNPSFIDWSEFNNLFENKTQTGRNKVKLNHILGELHDRGIHVMQQTTRTPGAGPITGSGDWAGKWEQWQHYYAMAFHSAKNYDVAQWQMYNEPNGDPSISGDIPQYITRLQLASDAIRSAIADVNSLYGKSLVADIAAPVSAGGAARVDDWGKAALQAIRKDYQTDFTGQASSVDIFNTYAAQVYGLNGAQFGAEATSIKNKIQTPGYHAGGPAAAAAMPLMFSEFNRHTSNNFATMPTVSLETSSVVSDIASIYVNAMAAGTESMYAFKFSQTMWLPNGITVEEPQKTGFHYVSDTGLKDITGATHAAGVVRLVAKGFQDRRDLLGTSLSDTTGTINGFDSASSYDPDTSNYYLLGVNRNTISHALTFDLNSWGIAPGTMVSVEEVRSVAGGSHNGEVVHVVPVGADGRITLNQPSLSAWLLTVPGGAPQTVVSLSPSADASVRNDAPASNFGASAVARVGRSPAATTFDYATYLKFSLGDTDAADVSRAILRLNGQSATDGSTADPGSILMHVYAIVGDDWDESTINWNNAPDLSDADTKTLGVGATAFPVGQLTFTGGVPQLIGIDITEFLRDHPGLFDDGQLSFALVREERFTGDADPTSSYVELFTKEAGGALAPQLMLFVPEPGSAAVLGFAGMAPLARRRRPA